MSGSQNHDVGHIVSTHVAIHELETELRKFWDMPFAAPEDQLKMEDYCEQQFNPIIERLDFSWHKKEE